MKLKLFLLSILTCGGVQASSSVINLSIAQLRNAAGAVIEDGGGTWAVIVSAIPGNPPTSGALPGGLANNSSLTGDNETQINQIKSSFNNVNLSVGRPDGKNYYIWQLGGFSSGNDLGLNGVVQAAVAFDVFSAPDPGFSANTLWGFYWFPGQSQGSTLTGAYQVGGFANEYNANSGGDEWGTTVPGSLTWTVNFYETNFNQTVLEGAATGLATNRFTAVAIPEPSAMLLTLLGSVALLRRRRA